MHGATGRGTPLRRSAVAVRPTTQIELAVAPLAHIARRCFEPQERAVGSSGDRVGPHVAEAPCVGPACSRRLWFLDRAVSTAAG